MGWVRAMALALLALVTAGVTHAAAQGTTGNILGIVTDPSGASVPGVTVTVKNAETGQTRVLTSDANGRYRAQGLPPGRYDVEAALDGFQTSQNLGLPLSIGQDLTVNVSLKVGGLDEKVVVTGEAALVNLRQSSVTALVDQTQIRELPLNGRDFSQLTLLQPGVTWASTSTQSVDRGMGTQVSVAGARPNQISFQLDGTDINTQGNGSPGSAAGGLLGVETVREFKVLVNNYSAEYGRSTGGIVTAVTRSGTNQLRGSLFEFFRADELNERTYFDPKDQPLPDYKRNQFGGYIGGPIRKDKTFFFGSYEGLRQDKASTNIADVPSLASRSRTDINPAVRPYLLLYPEPNGPVSANGQTAKYIFQSTVPTRENYAVGKIDQNLSPTQTASVRYSWDRASVFPVGGLGLWADRTETQSEFLVGEHSWVIRPTLLNSVKVAWNRAYENTENVDLFNVPTNLYIYPGTQFPSIAISGLTTLGANTQAPAFVDLKSLQVIQNLTWSRGSHTMKTGVAFTRWYNDQDASFNIGGTYNFTSLNNFLAGTANAFEGQTPGSTTDRQWRQNLIGIYLQDDWQVRSNLTINAGVRYEAFSVPKEAKGRVASFRNIYDPATGTFDRATTVGDPLFRNPSLLNFAPRVGFAWDITGDGRNALSGGAGYFFEPILGNIYRAYGNRTPPYYSTFNPSNPPFPNPAGATGATPLLRLDLFDFEPENPYRIQYNLTYQRELVAKTVVTLGFIGSRGYHQIRNVEANQAIATRLPDGRYFFPAGSTRRNPAFGSIRLRTTDGNSWYKGFVAGANRRFSKGLALQASYTFGDSIDQGSQAVGSGDFTNGFQPRYPDDPDDNKGPSDFNVRHNFVFNYTWEIPAVSSASGATAVLLNGWQLSGIVNLRSGMPFTPVLAFDRARALPRSGGAGQRPNLVSGCSANPVKGGPDQYFDVNCFSLPDAGYFGNLGRNTMVGPGYASWDSAIFKNIRLGDNRRLQIRVEGFNILNRANFGLPFTAVFNASGRVANAGQIVDIVGTAREFQLGIKLEF